MRLICSWRMRFLSYGKRFWSSGNVAHLKGKIDTPNAPATQLHDVHNSCDAPHVRAWCPGAANPALCAGWELPIVVQHVELIPKRARLAHRICAVGARRHAGLSARQLFGGEWCNSAAIWTPPLEDN